MEKSLLSAARLYLRSLGSRHVLPAHFYLFAIVLPCYFVIS